MALFKAKAKTAEEIMALIKGLPEEEIAKLGDMLSADEEVDGKVDGDTKPETTEEQIDEAKENIEEKGEDSQAEQDRIDESVGEQEKLDNDEDSQDAKDRVDESEATETADEKTEIEEAAEDNVEDDKKNDVIAALTARVDELAEKMANIVEKLEDTSFGNHQAEIAESENDGDSEDARIMKAYMGKQVYRK